jgi:hypothetical protein
MLSIFLQGEKMTAPPQYIQVYETIHPPEADRIAGQIRNLIQSMTSEQSNLHTCFTEVTNDWVGHQKDRFVDEVSPQQKKLADYIEYLRGRLTYYVNVNVGWWTNKTNPDWQTYQNTRH